MVDLRVRDDNALIVQTRQDANARALRRTLWGMTGAALWGVHHYRKSA